MSLTLAITAAFILLIAGLVGVLLTLLTLPGVWLTLAVALLCQWLFGEPRLFGWPTLITAAGLALAGEIFELVSGAVGAKRAGGGRSGAWGSIIGATVGAIVGSFVIPVVGTLIGAVAGAGAGALFAERSFAGREWSHAIKIGSAAATARLAATVVKAGIAAAVGALLTVAALVR